MTDTAAAFDNVIPFYGRAVSLGAYGRTIASHAMLALAALGTVAVLMVAVTFASAWILNTALSSDTRVTGSVRSSLQNLALVPVHPHFASADVAPLRTARNIPHPANPTFETRWARAMSSPSNGKVVRLTQERPWTLAMPSIPPAPATTHLAGLSPVGAPTIEPPGRLPTPPRVATTVPLPPPFPAEREVARSSTVDARPRVASLPTEPRRQFGDRSVGLPGPDSHTAIYDIAAHTVYLPNGERLEAHSGLGNKIDDPRYVRIKNRGPTPPNIYDLSLRGQLFHGVRAIRLTPVDGSRMYGRDGMLAHTYMLGPNGQSNGCVSFRNYQAFLRAYLRGEIDQLVVVPRLGHVPPRLASAILSNRNPDRRYAANEPPATSTVTTW